MPKLELISFKLCPFVQRAVIILNNKNVDFDLTFVDLNNLPDWFKDTSPLGKVPVLKVGDEVLFESSVIQEYVDEIHPPSLHPEEALLKAKNRAWITFGGETFEGFFHLAGSESEDAYLQHEAALKAKLEKLEDAHSGEDYFNGSEFNLIDAAFAPLLMRLDLLNQNCGKDLIADFPKIQHWSQTLLARNCVQNSVVPEFKQMFQGMLKMRSAYLASQMQAS